MFSCASEAALKVLVREEKRLESGVVERTVCRQVCFQMALPCLIKAASLSLLNMYPKKGSYFKYKH